MEPAVKPTPSRLSRPHPRHMLPVLSEQQVPRKHSLLTLVRLMVEWLGLPKSASHQAMNPNT